jgi:hypothetical protein
MEYEIVSSVESIQDLSEKVNERISQLWKPQGGVSLTSHILSEINKEPTLIYLQAVKGSL